MGNDVTKYRNTRTEFAGLTFHSKAEAKRYGELQILERIGQIRGLQRQVAYELAPPVKYAGASRTKPALRLVVDFSYWEGEQQILEDTKGVQTDVFKVKRHLLKAVHGLEVRLTR